MVKVCHMTSVHAKEDVRIFYKECSTLAKAGYDVYLVERGDSYEKNGVHIRGVGEMPESRLKRMTKGAHCVYKTALELDCDIYHFHDPELLPYGLKLKKKGKKVIFDSHENTALAIEEKEYIPKIVRYVLQKAYTSYEKGVCRRLDAVITVTPTQTAYFRQVNEKTTEVTNYPIFSEKYIEPAFEDKAVVFAGGISEQWNHDLIIESLKDLPDCKYVLCGPDNGYRKSLEKLPAWNQVDYKGKIPHAEVARVLSECMIGMALLTPGKNTAGKFGTIGNTKIFEEMMAGLPVICTDFDLWKDFVEKYKCGICVDPKNKNEVCSAIRYLITHPAIARSMGENGRRAVREEFNWESNSQALLKLYSEL